MFASVLRELSHRSPGSDQSVSDLCDHLSVRWTVSN